MHTVATKLSLTGYFLGNKNFMRGDGQRAVVEVTSQLVFPCQQRELDLKGQDAEDANSQVRWCSCRAGASDGQSGHIDNWWSLEHNRF